MERNQRNKLFVGSLKSSALVSGSPKWKFSQGTGISNRPTVVPLGLELIDADLAGVDLSKAGAPGAGYEGFVLWGTTILPPGNELFIAVYIQRDRDKFVGRLADMAAAGKAGEPQYAVRNNNVAVLASQVDKKLYLRNKERWDDVEDPSALAAFGAGIEADRVEYAVYRTTSLASRGLSVGAFVAFLGEIFPSKIIHEISPWPAESEVPPGFNRNPADVPIADIREGIKKRGGYYPDELVANFHAALNHLGHKHFVILSGQSGLGKTGLVLRYAMAIHGSDDSDRDPFLFVCAVKPDWTDPSGLLGYYDVILARYVVPPFLSAVLAAVAHPHVPVFVCIDEMNIARVEYYFADILSAFESRQPIHLHDNPYAYEGTNGEDIPAAVPMPKNLYIVGTVNVDETTYRISDKVLDRSNVVTLEHVSPVEFFDQLAAREPALGSSIAIVRPLLVRLINVLRPYGFPFGYRVMEELVRYLDFAVARIGVAPNDAVDDQIRQKILVKLHGSERERQMLVELAAALSGYPLSLRRAEAMLRDLNDFGSF